MWSNHERPQSSSQYVKFGVHCRSNRKLASHRLSWVTAGIRTLLLCPHRNWISVKRMYSTLEYFVYFLMNIFNIQFHCVSFLSLVWCSEAFLTVELLYFTWMMVSYVGITSTLNGLWVGEFKKYRFNMTFFLRLWILHEPIPDDLKMKFSSKFG